MTGFMVLGAKLVKNSFADAVFFILLLAYGARNLVNLVNFLHCCACGADAVLGLPLFKRKSINLFRQREWVVFLLMMSFILLDELLKTLFELSRFIKENKPLFIE